MYGMVNRSFEAMLRARHGDAAWERIKARAGVTSLGFISNEPYPDDVTYSLVGAASETLEVPAGELLEAFGEYWVLHAAREAYPDLMMSAGSSLPEFLGNLNNLHVRVGMLFPRLKPPRFVCTDVADGSLRLHHHTQRPGLAPFVVGLVRGLGVMFGTPATVDLESPRAAGEDHDVFLVRWTPS